MPVSAKHGKRCGGNFVEARFPACQLWRHPCRQFPGSNEKQHELAAGMPRSLATKDGCLYRGGSELFPGWQELPALGIPWRDMKTLKPKPDARRLISGFHFRGKLPHLKREGASYFTTFRLADSLPREAILKLKHEREALVQQAFAAKRPLTWQEEQQLFAWYSGRVEAFLDAGAGQCWLGRREIADLVASALNFFDTERYDLRAWVVMPNHVHAVVWPRTGRTLSEIGQSWKSFTASKANKMLGRVGEHFW